MSKTTTPGAVPYAAGRVFLLAVVAIILIATPTVAKNINSNAGTTGFSFLKLGVGAKAVAMGGAYTGFADDPSTMYYNPSGTMRIREKMFLAGYHNYVLDIQSGFVAAVLPVSFWVPGD